MNIKLAEKVLRNPHLIGRLVGKTKLTQLHGNWIKYLFGSKELIPRPLQAHRNSFKSTAIVEIGIPFYLLFHPNARIALVRKSWAMSIKAQTALNQILGNPDVKELFRQIQGKPLAVRRKSGSISLSSKSTITKEGSVEFYGIDNIPTGTHYDLIICDDIITKLDRYSKAEREKTNSNVMELFNILERDGRFIVIGTPWHSEDAFNLKNESGGSILPNPIKVNCYQSGIMSEGEIKSAKEKMTDELFAINYELEHRVSKKKVFSDAKFKPWDNRVIEIYAQLDTAFQGSHTAALTIAQRNFRTKEIIADGFVFTENVQSILHILVEKCAARKVKTLFVEGNADKGYTSGLLGELARGKFIVKDYAETSNKYVKIISYAKYNWGQIYFIPEIQDEYLSQVMDYENGALPDDAPDSLASLIKMAFTNSKMGILYGE